MLHRNVQTGSDAPPPSLLFYGYRVSLPGAKRPGRDVKFLPPSSAEARSERSYTSTPPICLHPRVLRSGSAAVLLLG